jgi:hypothetical protein
LIAGERGLNPNSLRVIEVLGDRPRRSGNTGCYAKPCHIVLVDDAILMR